MKNWISFLFVLGACLSVTAQEPDMASRVQEEIERGQMYDGEQFDRLVALGPDAVPALCDHLETYGFPMVILNVLAELGDARATSAILDFLENTRITWSSEPSFSKYAIHSLKEIADPRAEPLLLEIVSNESNHFAVRFHANTALARLGSPSVKAQAWDEIMSVSHGNVSDMYRSYRQTITYPDLYSGLVEVLTDAADERLAKFLTSGHEGYKTRPLMSQLARREETADRVKIVDALLYVAEHEHERGLTGGELLTQGLAFKVLFDLEAAPPERLAAIADTFEEVIEIVRDKLEDVPSVTKHGDMLLQLREEFFTKYPQFRKEPKAGEI